MKTSEASRFKALICFIVSITFYDRLFYQQNEHISVIHSSGDGNRCPVLPCKFVFQIPGEAGAVCSRLLTPGWRVASPPRPPSTFLAV